MNEIPLPPISRRASGSWLGGYVALTAIVGIAAFALHTIELMLPQPPAAPSVEVTQPGNAFLNRSKLGRLAVDGRYVWVANYAGLIRITKTTGEEQIYTAVNGLAGNGTDEVVSWNGAVWVASQCQGVSRVDPTTGATTAYTEADGLTNACNPVLYPAGDALWLGTFKGINRFDTTTGQWTGWKEVAGIPVRGVRQIVSNTRYVWASLNTNAYTRGGIVRFDRQTGQWVDQQSDASRFAPGNRMDFEIDQMAANEEALTFSADGKIYSLNLASETWSEEPLSAEATWRHGLSRATRLGGSDWRWVWSDESGRYQLQRLDSSGATTTVDTTQLQQRCDGEQSTGAHSSPFGSGSLPLQPSIDGDALWFGCEQGLAKYEPTLNRWSFIGEWPSYPAAIYQVHAAKNGWLLADTNLGLGLLEPAQQRWRLINRADRNDRRSEPTWLLNEVRFAVQHGVSDYFGTSASTSLWRYFVDNGRTEETTVQESQAALLLRPPLATDGWTGWWVTPTGTDSGDEVTVLTELQLATGQGSWYSIPDQYASSSGEVRTLVALRSELWLLAERSGVFRFATATRQFYPVAEPQGVGARSYDFNLVAIGDTLYTNHFHRWPWDAPIFAINRSTLRWHELSAAHPILRDDAQGHRNLVAIGRHLVVQSRYDSTVDGFVTASYATDVFDTERGTWSSLTAADGLLDPNVTPIADADGKTLWLVSSAGVIRIDLER